MATREHRMAEFSSAEPPANQRLELLCEDHRGTYVIPFACHFVNGQWSGWRGINLFRQLFLAGDNP
jgi:hypothetical protein